MEYFDQKFDSTRSHIIKYMHPTEDYLDTLSKYY